MTDELHDRSLAVLGRWESGWTDHEQREAREVIIALLQERDGARQKLDVIRDELVKLRRDLDVAQSYTTLLRGGGL